jgi:hypothetical protein
MLKPPSATAMRNSPQSDIRTTQQKISFMLLNVWMSDLIRLSYQRMQRFSHQPLPRDAVSEDNGIAKRMAKYCGCDWDGDFVHQHNLGLTVHIRWALCLSVGLRSVTVVIKRPTSFRLCGMKFNASHMKKAFHIIKGAFLLFGIGSTVPVRGRHHACRHQFGQPKPGRQFPRAPRASSCPSFLPCWPAITQILHGSNR